MGGGSPSSKMGGPGPRGAQEGPLDRRKKEERKREKEKRKKEKRKRRKEGEKRKKKKRKKKKKDRQKDGSSQILSAAAFTVLVPFLACLKLTAAAAVNTAAEKRRLPPSLLNFVLRVIVKEQPIQ